MKISRITLLRCLVLFSFALNAQQTKEELHRELAIKKDSIAAIQARVNAIQGQIDAMPGWRFKAFGVLGFSISEFSHWYSKQLPNSSAGNIGITSNILLDLKKEKFFWKNAANINLQWIKVDNKDSETDNKKFQQATDVFNLSSLYGYNLGKKIAVSTLAEYRTTLIENFNNPGYLDLGLGATVMPFSGLVIVAHPLNENFVFSNSSQSIYNSSLGAKLMIDYTKSFAKFNLKSNFSLFQSYQNANLSNWTWINSFSYTIWKGIGVGFDFGLRRSDQETLSYHIEKLLEKEATFSTIQTKIQSYMLFGVSYAF